MDSAYVRHARQTVVGGFSSALVYLRGILLLPILTRALGPEDYGIWVQVLGGIELMVAVSGLGLGLALMRFIPAAVDGGRATDSLLSSLLVGAGGGTLVALAARGASSQLAATFLGAPENAGVLVTATWLVPLGVALTLVMTYFRARSRMGIHAVLVALETAGWLLLAFGLLGDGMGLRGFVEGLLVIRAGVLILGLLVLLVWGPLEAPTFRCLRGFLSYGIPLLPLGVLTWLTNASDRYVIAYFVGPAEAGVYAVSYAIGSLVGLVFSPVFAVLIPTTARMWDRSRVELIADVLRLSQKYPLLVAVPMAVLLTAKADWVIANLATSSFAASPALVGLTAMGIAAMNLGAICETVLALGRQTVRILLIYAAAAGINVCANLVMVPLLGALGAAMTTAVTYAGQAWLIQRASRRLLSFTWELRTAGVALLSTVPGLGLLAAVGERALVFQIGALALGGVVYVRLLGWFGVIGNRDWQIARVALGRDRSCWRRPAADERGDE